MIKKLILIFSIQSIFLNAQTPSLNSAEILQSLKKLNSLGTVLYIAAHPDDENTRLLTYLSKELKLKTGYLSLTRGDGGQNLIGKEQGDLLGLIRTQELLAARRVDGAEQFFTRANDFGYSKNPEETLKIWGKDSILADIVWVIRKFKPDVIICRFPVTGEGGHGHHTASAILAVEAFDAAADPNKFSYQLNFVETWQATRIFFNAFNFGASNTTAPNQLKIDVGGFNPLLGKSYGEMAAESRTMHKSQGFGSAKTRGSQVEYFKILKGDSASNGLFEEINQSWNRVKGGNVIHGLIEKTIKGFDISKPAESIKDLVNIYRAIQQLDSKDSYTQYWKQQKLKETEILLLSCAGFWSESYAASYYAVPGNSMSISTQVIARNPSKIKLERIVWSSASDTFPAIELKQNELLTFKHVENIPSNIPFSGPYWLNEPHESGLFVIKDQSLIGKPENYPAMLISLFLNIDSLPIRVDYPLLYKSTDPVKGEIYRPFEILPPATVNLSEKNYVFDGENSQKIQINIKSKSTNVEGKLHIKTSEGWTASLKEIPFKLASKEEELSFEVMLSPGKISKGKLSVELEINSKKYSKSIQRIEYDHIPYQFTLNPSEANLVKIPVKKAGINIGYIPGAGDDLPACLKQIGYHVSILTDELLSKEDLSKFNAIITGVRAYNTNERLQNYHTRLMEYVNKGGNLIVQYNTNNRIGPLLAKIGPYPFTISRERVTDETAKIMMLKENHPAFNYPNKINTEDFNGWVQERGIYFATELDKNYETIISTNDPNEKPQEGSVIIAKYGKGNFVYTGLAFFRQLPAGVPGAYRLFTNLISLPPNK